jgi:segregation and condensation protein A
MEMAATLMEIKSRALLPKAERELLTEDPEKDLIKQLEEYRVFKEASEKLKEKENVDRLYREPSPDIDRPVYTIKDLSLDNLLDAFAKIMCRMELIKHEKENPKEIKKDAYTVAQKINYIRLKLIENSSLDFFELCDESGDIPEVVVTFMAILELAKRQIVSVLQDDICESITVMLKQEHKDDMFDYEEELG